MKGLTTLCGAFLVGSIAFSGWRVSEAQRLARHELRQLDTRIQETRELLKGLVPASRDQIKSLRAQTERLNEQAGLRRASLLDRAFATPPPALSALLSSDADSTPPLSEKTRERLLELTAEEPALELGFASILHEFRASPALRLETFELREQGLSRPLPHARGLAAVDAELVALGDLDAILGAFESLVPGRGEPLVIVEHASLRRLEPELWASLPDTQAEPPARLWVHLSLVYGEASP